MAGKPTSNNVLLGKGKLLFDRIDANGVRTGYIALGNCSEFGLTTEIETAEMKSSLDQGAATYKEVVKSKAATFKISGFEFEPDTLALVLMGDKSEYIQPATAVTAEALAPATATKKGRFFKTAKRAITAVTVKQGAALTLGTDYEIYDAEAGIIFFPTTSAVVDATAVTIDYTPTVITAGSGRTTLLGMTNGKIEGVLLFVGDPITGPKYEFEGWKVSMKPDGDLNFIGDDFASWGLTGKCQDDSAGAYGGSSLAPFYRLLKRP